MTREGGGEPADKANEKRQLYKPGESKMSKTAYMRFLGAAALGLLLALSTSAQAAWPEKAIQIIVPFGAGGDTDYNARTYAKYLKPLLGTSLAVVNVTGGGGSIGARKAKDAAPDGYTVLFFHDALMVNTATGVADFSWRDFELVAIVGQDAGTTICVQSKSKWKTLKELVTDSAAHPKEISIAGNIGATTYLAAQLLNQQGGSFNIVNHGGAAARVTALLGGHVDVIQNPLGTVKGYIESGDFRPLAVQTQERNPFAPNIPTLKEEGYNIYFQYRYYFLFPKGTPKAIVEKFGAAVEKVVTTKEYATDISKFLQTPIFAKGEKAIKLMEEQEALVNSVDLK